MIEIKELTKVYSLNRISVYPTFREKLDNLFLFQKKILNNKENISVLKNITLNINKGEVVGIIGPNGSGKSTLLKIISRVTQPTNGSVRYRGKVSAILEVGTGFHPELTGRENIFLNCVILGMKRRWAEEKMNEIIEFSGVEDYIDVPVKKYSSGMYARLAFSVLMHLDTDIILIDEVLAVGDLDFQKKCINRIMEMKNNLNKTILFVSHNVEVVQAICEKCVFLNKGNLVKYGETADVIGEYLSFCTNSGSVNENVSAGIKRFEIYNDKGNQEIKSGDKLKLTVELMDNFKNHKLCRIIIGIYNNYSQLLLRIDSGDLKISSFNGNKVFIETDPIHLFSISCYANIAIFLDGVMIERVLHIKRFNIISDDRSNLSDRPILSIKSNFSY